MSTFPTEKIGDKYVYEGPLGSGSAGLAELFKIKETGEIVAIKKVGINVANRDSLFRELNFLKSSNHKNIIKLFDAWKSDDDELFTVREAGKANLEEFLVKFPIKTLEEVARISFQIISGVNYMHKRGLIHADLKFGNIVIAGDYNEVKIIDFDRSVPVEKAKNNAVVIHGTVGYEAPELIMGEHFDCKADCWTVGVIIAEMIIADDYLFVPVDGQSFIDLYHFTLGTPSESYLEKINHDFKDTYFKNKTYEGFKWEDILGKKDVIKNSTEEEKESYYDLLNSLIKFDPDERLSMEKALKHKFLSKFQGFEDYFSEISCYDPTVEKEVNNDWRKAFDDALDKF
uniref:Protein kinase domain-containing protein n=1 Tax=Panagrolaimus sp. ES5 TaxID=591445 RepID=A0AC34FIC9_9BILA